jgi:hypothetical protein
LVVIGCEGANRVVRDQQSMAALKDWKGASESGVISIQGCEMQWQSANVGINYSLTLIFDSSPPEIE